MSVLMAESSKHLRDTIRHRNAMAGVYAVAFTEWMLGYEFFAGHCVPFSVTALPDTG